MSEYFIGLILNPGHARLVDKFRHKFYARSAKRHPPHITVVGPFLQSEIKAPAIKSEDDLCSLINEAAANFKLTHLKIESIDVMSGKDVIRLVPDKNLVELRGVILAKAGLTANHDYFSPHITLGCLDNTAREKARSLFIEGIKEISPTFLQLYRKEPKDGDYIWRAINFSIS